MRIIFDKEYLKELYEEGKAKNKKYRFQKTVVKKYVQTVDKMRAADRVEDLFVIRSLQYKKLVGDKNGLESVRVDKKYRIEFRTVIESDGIEKLTICSIIELSNHYQ